MFKTYIEDDFIIFKKGDEEIVFKIGETINQLVLNNMLFRNFRFEYEGASNSINLVSSHDCIIVCCLFFDFVFSVNQYKTIWGD